MNKRDAMKLQVGDHIRLKHNLGEGDITEVALEPRAGLPGRYPMLRFIDCVTGQELWSTYRIIKHVTWKLRSVQ